MPPVTGVVCVHCRREQADPAWHPFCSERCKLADLARWVDGEYRIPSEPVGPDPADPDEPASTDS